MAGHLGTGSSLCKAREVIYWPRIMTELRDYFTRCDVCLRHRDHQRKEPLQPQLFGTRPLEKVAADLATLTGRTLLVVTDYFSDFIEVSRLNTTSVKAAFRALKEIFSRFGIPEELCTDNGP